VSTIKDAAIKVRFKIALERLGIVDDGDQWMTAISVRVKQREEQRRNVKGKFTFCKGCFSCIHPCKRVTKEMYEKDKEEI
jgi:hypothetical protein